MRTLFFKIFLGFLAAILIFALIMITVLIYGFNSSINKWKKDWLNSVKNSIDYSFSESFKNDDHELNETSLNVFYNNLPHNIVIIIYDINKKNLLTVKKIGKGRQERLNERDLKYSQLYPVKIKNSTIYYYSFAYPDNREDMSYLNLINSIRLTFAAGIFVSFFIAVFFALFFSKRISNESKVLSQAIDRMAHGDLGINIKQTGTKEINIIAESVNIFKEKIKKEKQLREQWSEDIAHDLRTPIAALKAQLEGMHDGVLDISRDRIQKNLNELSKIENLVSDLSVLIRLESPEITISIKPINSDNFFTDIINSFHQITEEREIKYSFINNAPDFNGDEKLLSRAFSNIINNALIYADAKGSVSVNAEKKETKTVIEIFNSGSYINGEESKKIFDRLYRGEYSRTAKGSGLGLTIAKRIIELHSGTIEVKSDKQKGTSFIVSL